MASIRAKLVVQKISENIRNPRGMKHTSMGKILREAGYSKAVSLKPKLVTETKGFKEEFARVIPDELLVKTHLNLLEAYKLEKYVFMDKMSDIDIKQIIEGFNRNKIKEVRRDKNNIPTCYYWTPDCNSINKALDMAIKVKGYYHLKEKNINTQTVVEIVNYAK